MFDGMNEMSTLSYDYIDRLHKVGIKAQTFSPLKPILSTYYNYRDHRKITVIDGQVGYTGGVNIADEYVNKRELSSTNSQGSLFDHVVSDWS